MILTTNDEQTEGCRKSVTKSRRKFKQKEIMKDVKELCRDLSVETMQEVNGGGLFTVRGAMDGVKKNTEVFIFGIRIYHGSAAGGGGGRGNKYLKAYSLY